MSRGDFTRWLYRGKRPNRIARVVNRMWAVIFSLGIVHNYAATLEVTGRKSGRKISLPVAIAVVGGERYLVSMLGDNVQWVRNVRASNGRAALLEGKRKEIRLQELPAERRAPILKAYLRRAPGARPHIPMSQDAPLSEFEKIAAAYPVFRVAPATAATG